MRGKAKKTAAIAALIGVIAVSVYLLVLATQNQGILIAVIAICAVSIALILRKKEKEISPKPQAGAPIIPEKAKVPRTATVESPPNNHHTEPEKKQSDSVEKPTHLETKAENRVEAVQHQPAPTQGFHPPAAEPNTAPSLRPSFSVSISTSNSPSYAYTFKIAGANAGDEAPKRQDALRQAHARKAKHRAELEESTYNGQPSIKVLVGGKHVGFVPAVEVEQVLPFVRKGGYIANIKIHGGDKKTYGGRVFIESDEAEDDDFDEYPTVYLDWADMIYHCVPDCGDGDESSLDEADAREEGFKKCPKCWRKRKKALEG